MSIILEIVGAILLAVLALYCLWHGVKGLRTREVESPTMMSPGTTKASEAPVTYWILETWWFFGAGAIGVAVFKWLRAISEA